MTTTLAELEARIVAMEQVNAIKELQQRYWGAVDRQKLDQVRDCFVETGAMIDMQGVPPCADREEFIKMLRAQGGKPNFLTLHTGNNPFITLTGPDSADGAWDAFFIGIDVDDRLTYQLSGEYKNRYVLRDGRWFIQTQRFRQTSLLVQKIGDDGVPSVLTFGLPDPMVFGK